MRFVPVRSVENQAALMHHKELKLLGVRIQAIVSTDFSGS